jgi:hypothetical protein
VQRVARDTVTRRKTSLQLNVVTSDTVTPSLGCAHFHNDDPRGEVWTGQWPGEDDCTRLGFYVNGDPDFPDLNRLFTDCVWDADAQRWERKQ